MGILLVYLLLLQINIKDNINLLWQIKLSYLLAGAVLYFFRYCIRTIRFNSLNQISSKIRLFKLLKVVFATSLASQTLPFRLGDLAFIYLTKKECELDVESGVISIMMIRIFDLFSAGVIFLFGVFFLKNFYSSFGTYIIIIAVFVFLIVLAILALLVWNHKLLLFLQRILDIVLSRWQLLHEKTNHFISRLDDSFLTLSGNFNFISFSFLSIIEWMINYFIFYLLFLGLSIDIRFSEALISITFAAFASILPINSIGNFGTHEVGWSAGLILLGFPKEIAVMTGFASHIYMLLYIIFFGGIAWLTLLKAKKND